VLGAAKEEQEKCIREVIAIHKRIVKECPDEPGNCTKANSLQQLALAYNLTGDKETAIEYAKGLPFYTSEVLRWIILEGEEKLAKTIENLAIFAHLMLEHAELLDACEDMPIQAATEGGGFSLREITGIYKTIAEKLERRMEQESLAV